MRKNELNVKETLRKAQLKHMRHVYSELANTKSLIQDAIECEFSIFQGYRQLKTLKDFP